jgi:hypothetical protein
MWRPDPPLTARAPEGEAIGEFQFHKRSQLFKANGKNEIARAREQQG